MNNKMKALFLFLILLFGLMLCSFLGGNCNKEGYESMYTIQLPGTISVTNTPDNASSTSSSNSSNNYNNYNHYTGTATPNPNSITSTQYYGSTGTSVNPKVLDDAEATIQNPMSQNTMSQNPMSQNPMSQNAMPQNPNTNISSSDGYGDQYYSTLPPGIPRSQIAPGNEDLYILKSEIVPPVCPICPAFSSASPYDKKETCPPCPPCGRCPESSFECKKVPNYNALNNSDLPIPVLNDFSSFGM